MNFERSFHEADNSMKNLLMAGFEEEEKDEVCEESQKALTVFQWLIKRYM